MTSVGAGIQQMLAVVQHHQQLPVADELQQAFLRGAARLVRQPSARATVTGTSSGSVIGARSTYQIPSAYRPRRPRLRAPRRALPTPPAPFNVTNLFCARMLRTSPISVSRPTKLSIT